MGSGASTTGYVDSVDPISSLNEQEGEVDLQLATTNILRTHMLRLSQLGKIFSTLCKDGKETLMVEDFIKHVKRDPISRVFTTMPAQYNVEGKVLTFGDIYKEIIEKEKGEPKAWIQLIKYFKMVETNSKDGIKYIRNVFDKLDQNSNGKVSKSEFLISLQNDPTVAAILGLPAIVKENEETNTVAIKSFIDIFYKIDKDADLEVDWEEFLKFFVYEENEGDRGEQKTTSGIAEEANEDEEEKTEAVTTSTAKLELGESSTTTTTDTITDTTTTDTITDTTTTDTTVPVEIMTKTIDNITTEVEPSKEELTKEEPTSG
jgi:Ca2+-binding EF-hand superfamily protein